MNKEKVLELEFQDVFDKVAWRVKYQNEDMLKRGKFEDREIGVRCCMKPYNDKDYLYLRGEFIEDDNEIIVTTKEQADIIKNKVNAINEKYGVFK